MHGSSCRAVEGTEITERTDVFTTEITEITEKNKYFLSPFTHSANLCH